MPYMSRAEIDAHGAEPWPPSPADALARARAVMAKQGLAQPNQQMGQRWPIGCVALEITQRCNLDCTLCYLSENSEAVKDIPLDQVMARVESIFNAYGINTDVQVTGGEPTLRKRDELLAIVRRIHALGMRATLMTNGIRATRALLGELAAAGLADVAFHVDTTQQRRGYQTEADLNALRQRYLERAAGLPLSVMFNTTVHDGNFDEIPAVVAYFRGQAGRIRTASFQLQADIGRGVQGARGQAITPETAAAQIERGAGTPLQFSASLIGHPSCSRYGMCLAANGNLYNAFDDLQLVAALQRATAGVVFDRTRPTATARRLAYWLCGHPVFWAPVMRWLTRKAWAMREDLVRSRGRVHTLSFVIHNFMDASKLEADRIEACAFKVITADGPMSMCLHNARRDAFILRPIRFHRGTSSLSWNPLTGTETSEAAASNGDTCQPRSQPVAPTLTSIA
ncbi:radical SAM protein [Cupriavidus sp. IK-TO18]|uniref:radical SAM protein n=1 Tax=unclassified Cupriavidus TaxID=2640874 RepID=UPI001898F766|nr:radical SAM protein [Cupriavidus sp. IK-TO18]MBF6989465.1 radical SAM protein [Cupriavidus sp. IK-TO18]